MTFGRLRYSLGGDRPSQTAHQTLFPFGLGSRSKKSGISRLTPPRLASGLRSLPPILHILDREPMSSCSKAPRGLFVLPRVTRIFTGPAISPSPPLRQRPSRYAFRAGRNLPDKGFRYLRTVIVTAAVHRGFGSELSLLSLTYRHWAGVSPYTSACALARTCVCGKQSLGPFPAALGAFGAKPNTPRAPLLPKVRGQVAEFLNGGSLDRLGAFTPVHQCRFAVRTLRSLDGEAFLGGIGSTQFPEVTLRVRAPLSY